MFPPKGGISERRGVPNFGQKKSFAEAKDNFLAGAERLELPTPGFGDRCSTN